MTIYDDLKWFYVRDYDVTSELTRKGPTQVPTGCPHKFTNQIHRRRGQDIQTQTTWRYLKINLIKNKDHIQITFRSFSACPCHFPNTAAMPNMPSCHSTSISWQYQALPKSEWTADNLDNCKKVWIESQFIQRFWDRSVNLLLNCEVYVAFLVKYDFLVWIDLIHPWLWRFCGNMISRFEIRLDRISPGNHVATRRPNSYVEGEKNVDCENDILRTDLSNGNRTGKTWQNKRNFLNHCPIRAHVLGHWWKVANTTAWCEQAIICYHLSRYVIITCLHLLVSWEQASSTESRIRAPTAWRSGSRLAINYWVLCFLWRYVERFWIGPSCMIFFLQTNASEENIGKPFV